MASTVGATDRLASGVDVARRDRPDADEPRSLATGRQVPHDDRLVLPPVTASLPSPETQQHVTDPSCPESTPTEVPLPASHNRAVPSSLTDNTRAESGVKTQSLTRSSCSPNAATRRPVATSHTRTISSQLPETRRPASVEKAQQEMRSS